MTGKMNETRNPFEHYHPPTSPAQRGGVNEDIDPARQSLADALRVSFWGLKIVIVLLLIAYAFSGWFSVTEQQMAVRLRFGRIVGEPGNQVLGSGGPYFAFPFPIEQVIRVPVSPDQIEINRAFWYDTPSTAPGALTSGRSGRPGPLNPEKDGSLLTGDANVVHTRWTVTYTVADPVRFVRRIGDEATARVIVTAAAEGAIVLSVARLPADDLIRSQQIDSARQRAQDTLDAMSSGIKVTSLSMKESGFPLSAQEAVQAVLNAESEKARSIEGAKQQWDTILGNTAGEAYRPLLGLIEEYERVVDLTDQSEQAVAWQLQDQLDEVFDRLKIRDGDRVLEIGGEVASLLHQAKTYRTEVVAQIRGETQYFMSLLPQYRQNPQIVLNRLWQDAKQEILTGDIETIYLPSGQAYVELNRDPAVRQERERKRLVDEQKNRYGPNE